MRKILTILIFQAIAICAIAGNHVIEKPDYMPLFADGVYIEKVEFDDQCTTLFFHATRQKWNSISFLSSTFLVDEQGNRYGTLSCKGIKFDEWTKIGEDGALDFSVSFTPLPEGTRVFDCIEGPSSNRYFRFYGIRAKGQNWDIFNKGTESDNPFLDSFFHIDTIYVSGRISDSHYERGNGKGVHYVNSNSQQNLIRTFRENKGLFDFFDVAEDGSFSFKTLAAKPCMDALGLFGTEIPVLLIPGDHLHLEITRLGEYNQQVKFKSDFADYSHLLTNIPFMHDEEIDNPSFDNSATLSMQTWESLHEKQDCRLQIARYISAKHHLTQTEQKLMQMAVMTNCAILSISKMQMAVNRKYEKDVYAAHERKEQFPHPMRYTEQQLAESGIITDFSFLKECQMNDPHIVALPSYEAILHNLSEFGNHIMFSREAKNGKALSNEENSVAMSRMLGFNQDLGQAIIAEYIADYVYDPVSVINGKQSTGFEKNMEHIQQLKEQINLPYIKALIEARCLTLSHVHKERVGK